MHGTDAIRASCASSADTSVMNSAGWAVSNHDAMTATACVMLFQPSGAQWRFAGDRGDPGQHRGDGGDDREFAPVPGNGSAEAAPQMSTG